MNRRTFLLGAGATLVSGCSLPLLRRTDADCRLSFGVLSDIHITDWASTEILRKTLAYFRDRGVDAVMIAGDMADRPKEADAGIWYQPDAIRSLKRLRRNATMSVTLDRKRFDPAVEAVRVHIFVRNSYGVTGDRLVTDWLPFPAA